MKLGILTGWVIASLLGTSVILGPSTATAGFVTIDDFADPYDSPADVGGVRDGNNVNFENELVATGDGEATSGIGGSNPIGGGDGIGEGEPDGGDTGENGSEGTFLIYNGLSLNGLTKLRFTDVSNPDVTGTGSGSDVTVGVQLFDSGGSDLLGEPYDHQVPTNGTDDSFPGYVDFTFEDLGEVAEIFFTFSSTESFSLTSSSLQADFDTTNSGENPQATPEPTSLVLFGLASAGGGIAAWRKRRKQLTV